MGDTRDIVESLSAMETEAIAAEEFRTGRRPTSPFTVFGAAAEEILRLRSLQDAIFQRGVRHGRMNVRIDSCTCTFDEYGNGPIDVCRAHEEWCRSLLEAEKAKVVRLVEAGDRVLIGSNHAALLIGADHPPASSSCDEARAHYYATKNPDAYEAWCCWKTIWEFGDVLSAITDKDQAS
jgi:hypothetical protein